MSRFGALSDLVIRRYLRKFGLDPGKDVTIVQVGGIPELVTDGGTGFLVPARAPAEIAERVIQLLQDPALRTRMGAAGRLAARFLGLDATTCKSIAQQKFDLCVDAPQVALRKTLEVRPDCGIEAQQKRLLVGHTGSAVRLPRRIA